jgi:hypothetical protein
VQMQCNEFKYETGDGLCAACPAGGMCTEGTTVTNMMLAPGYWRTTVYSEAVYSCTPGHCLGTAPNENGTGTAHTCAPGHTGPRCSVCTSEFFYSAQADVCVACEAERGRGLMWAVLAAIVVPVLALAVATALHKLGVVDLVTKTMATRKVSRAMLGSVRTKSKVLISQFQVLGQVRLACIHVHGVAHFAYYHLPAAELGVAERA